MAQKKAPSLEDILACATPVERVVSVCVAGKLVGEHQELEARLQAAQNAQLADRRLSSGDGDVEKIAKQLRKLEDQMREHTYTFRFKALPPKKFSDLVAKHPHPDKSAKMMFDPETFSPALIAACCTSPEGMDDPEKVAALMEVLSPAQQSDLFDGAWEVNNTAPKEMNSFAASAVLLNSEQNSTIAASVASLAQSSSEE